MNTRILVPVLAVAVLAGGASYGTFAFFADTETSTANIFTGATLDLTTDDEQGVSGSVGDQSMTPGDSTSGSVVLKAAGSLTSGLLLDILIDTDDDTGSSGDYEEQDKVGASDGASSDNFGEHVAISGNIMVLSADQDDDAAGTNQGSVYVFTTSDGGATWTEQQKLTASDAAAGDNFGDSVDISGTTIVVGAPFADPEGRGNAGAVYVYTTSDGGATWTEQQKLVPADQAANDAFGDSVAIDGDTLVAGSPEDDDGGDHSGGAYVFTRSGSTWTEQAKLTADDAAAWDFFGEAVAVSGDKVVVSAPYDDDNGSSSGSAYVFKTSDGGATWTQQDKLTASDGAADDDFGTHLAIDGDSIVVGAPFTDGGGADSGSAYIFTTSDAGASWTEQQEVVASNAAAGDEFGFGVTIQGNTVIVGAHYHEGVGPRSGAAYIFTRSGSTWTQDQILEPADSAEYDWFASSVDLDGDYVAVGSHLDDDQGSNSGSAYVFQATTFSEDLAQYLLVTQLDYDGVALALPGDVDGDGRSNTLADLNDNGAFTGQAAPGAAGKTLDITVKLDDGASNSVMGASENLTLKFLLRQSGAPSL